MDSAEKELLREVIAVALACAPRAVKKAFADRYDPNTEAAARKLSEAVTAAVVQHLSVKDKPEESRGFMSRLPPPPLSTATATKAS